MMQGWADAGVGIGIGWGGGILLIENKKLSIIKGPWNLKDSMMPISLFLKEIDPIFKIFKNL